MSWLSLHACWKRNPNQKSLENVSFSELYWLDYSWRKLRNRVLGLCQLLWWWAFVAFLWLHEGKFYLDFAAAGMFKEFQLIVNSDNILHVTHISQPHYTKAYYGSPIPPCNKWNKSLTNYDKQFWQLNLDHHNDSFLCHNFYIIIHYVNFDCVIIMIY